MQLDLERIALGLHFRPVEIPQYLRPYRLESARRVAHRKRGQRADIETAERADKKPALRPVEHGNAPQITRADGQVRPALERLDQLRDIRRIMRKVGIHLYGGVIAVLDRPLESAPVGAAKTGLFLAFEEVHAIFELRSGAHHICRAIGRTVIDDKNVDFAREVQHKIQRPVDRFALVVSRDNHHSFVDRGKRGLDYRRALVGRRPPVAPPARHDRQRHYEQHPEDAEPRDARDIDAKIIPWRRRKNELDRAVRAAERNSHQTTEGFVNRNLRPIRIRPPVRVPRFRHYEPPLADAKRVEDHQRGIRARRGKWHPLERRSG